jgi:hypothetical protein
VAEPFQSLIKSAYAQSESGDMLACSGGGGDTRGCLRLDDQGILARLKLGHTIPEDLQVLM